MWSTANRSYDCDNLCIVAVCIVLVVNFTHSGGSIGGNSSPGGRAWPGNRNVGLTATVVSKKLPLL